MILVPGLFQATLDQAVGSPLLLTQVLVSDLFFVCLAATVLRNANSAQKDDLVFGAGGPPVGDKPREGPDVRPLAAGGMFFV